MPEAASSELIDALNRGSSQHTEQIVLDFGIDRFLQSLAQYGTLLLIAIQILFSFSPPISCINNFHDSMLTQTNSRVSRAINYEFTESKVLAQSSKLQVTTALKGFLDYYCWENLDDLNFTSTNETEPYDPRDLMGDQIFLLFIQLILLSLPSQLWFSIVGGTVKGQILYIQQLLDKVVSRADLIKKVTPQLNITGKLNRDMYDKYSETIKPWIFPMKYPDADVLGQYFNNESNDRKFLNLLCSENMAHFWQYPYLMSLYVLKAIDRQDPVDSSTVNVGGSEKNGSEKTKLIDRKDKLYERIRRLKFIRGEDADSMSKLAAENKKVDSLEAILRIWTNENNMIESYLVFTYYLKQFIMLLVCIAMYAWNCYQFEVTKMPFKDLPSNTYQCLVQNNGVSATCIIGGYTNYFFLFWGNLFLLKILFVLALAAVYLLRFKKMKHHSAYFLNFLANTTLLFDEANLEEMVEEGGVVSEDVVPEDDGSDSD